MESRNLKILIGTPVRDEGWILPRYFEALSSLDYPSQNLGFFFIVNNSTDNTREQVHDFTKKQQDRGAWAGYNILNWPDLPRNRRKAAARRLTAPPLAEMRNQILKAADEMGYDFAFLVDADVLVRPDTLSVLLGHNKDVVAALVHNSPIDKFVYNFLQYNPKIQQYFRPRKELPQNDLLQVGLTGACILISRPVFEKCKHSAVELATDKGFADACRKNGFTQWIDTYHKVEHILTGGGK